MNHPLILVCAILDLIDVILLLAASVDPEFVVMGDYYGAFLYCIGGLTIGCSSYWDYCPIDPCWQWRVFTALLVGGIITTGITTAITFYYYFRPDVRFLNLPLVTVILCFIQSAAILISWALFTNLTTSIASYRGASYGLEVSAWVISLLIAVIMLYNYYCIKRRRVDHNLDSGSELANSLIRNHPLHSDDISYRDFLLSHHHVDPDAMDLNVPDDDKNEIAQVIPFEPNLYSMP